MDTKLNIYKVYKHTSPSGKVYIGITSTGEENRWSSGMGYSRQPYFFKSIVKYGWINFKHEILFENLTRDSAYKIESELIKKHKSSDINFGYNIHGGGRIKFVKNRSGRIYKVRTNPVKLDPKHWRSVLKYDLNNNVVEKFKNVSFAAIDACVPVETLRCWLKRKKIKIHNDFYYKYENDISTKNKFGYRTVPINRYDLSGVYIDSFDSIEDAGKKLNIKTNHIPCVCRGRRTQCGGYKWKYKE